MSRYRNVDSLTHDERLDYLDGLVDTYEIISTGMYTTLRYWNPGSSQPVEVTSSDVESAVYHTLLDLQEFEDDLEDI